MVVLRSSEDLAVVSLGFLHPPETMLDAAARTPDTAPAGALSLPDAPLCALAAASRPWQVQQFAPIVWSEAWSSDFRDLRTRNSKRETGRISVDAAADDDPSSR